MVLIFSGLEPLSHAEVAQWKRSVMVKCHCSGSDGKDSVPSGGGVSVQGGVKCGINSHTPSEVVSCGARD